MLRALETSGERRGRYGKSMKRIAIIAATALLLAGCGATGPDWTQYAPEVKERIDTAGETGDCQALQDDFDAADSRSDADLMAYIDSTMRGADCY